MVEIILTIVLSISSMYMEHNYGYSRDLNDIIGVQNVRKPCN